MRQIFGLKVYQGRIVKTALAAVLLALFARIARADRCEIIRAMLADLPVAGGEVVVPAGNYSCDHPIMLNQSNVTLDGKGKVNLVLSDGADSPVIIMGNLALEPDPVNNIHVKNMRIDGNRCHQPDECWKGPCDSGELTHIRNNGITVRGVIDGSIEKVEVENARSGGVVTEKGCVRLTVDGLSVTGSQFDGFAGYMTTESTLKNMRLFNNNAAGISLDLNFNGNSISDSKIDHNHQVGIFMRDSRRNHFKNIVIEDNGGHGIMVSLTREGDRVVPDTCPTDNVFSDVDVLRSGGFGLDLHDCRNNEFYDMTFNQNSSGSVPPLLQVYQGSVKMGQ